jgi:hypothetical protein
MHVKAFPLSADPMARIAEYRADGMRAVFTDLELKQENYLSLTAVMSVHPDKEGNPLSMMRGPQRDDGRSACNHMITRMQSARFRKIIYYRFFAGNSAVSLHSSACHPLLTDEGNKRRSQRKSLSTAPGSRKSYQH